MVGLGLLYVLSMLLVACEISLVKLRYRALESHEDDTIGEAAADYLMQNAGRVAPVIRFFLILSSFVVGILIQRLLLEIWFGAGLQGMGNALLWDACAVFLAVTIWYIFADLLPRSWALRKPQRALRCSASVARLLVFLLGPWVRLANRSAKALTPRGAGDEPADFDLLDVEVQLRALGGQDLRMGPLARKIVTNGLKMNELVVSDVMLPRNQVQILDLSDSLEENIAVAKTFGHTRYPLCEEDLDRCVGVIHIKDIFRFKGKMEHLRLRNIKREIVSLSSEEPLENALKLLLLKKGHMALVLDEFGGTIGVLTLENIFEQLVGAIDDEFDAIEEEKVSAISLVDYKVDGLTPLHDLEEILEIEIENDDVSTFGGLITSELGRFPENGEQVVLEDIGLSLTIDEVDERRIISVTVRKLPKPEDDEDHESSSRRS